MGGLAIPCSGVQEKEIVFGGDRRLDEQLKATVEIAKADLICRAHRLHDGDGRRRR
jgi:nitrogenase molybdenum-iron protein alpha/beta subunit